MALNYQSVLLALPKLSPKELQQVRLRVTALIGGGGGPVEEVAIAEDYLYDGICAELRRRGLLGRSAVLPTRLLTPEYKRVAALTRALLDEKIKLLSSAEKAILGQLAARCLASYLENARVPVSPSTLLKSVSKIPVAIDQAFPGYLESGLLSFCWKK